MQEDSSIDDIYEELHRRQKLQPTELRSQLTERFVTDLLQNSNLDISLGEYLNIHSAKPSKHNLANGGEELGLHKKFDTGKDQASENITVTNKLIGLLDDLEKEVGMEDEIFELDEIDLSCMTGKARKELEKNLFINHKKKIRQSGDNRIRNYSNTNIEIGKESSMSPLSLRQYNME